jgi:hypothetical protein
MKDHSPKTFSEMTRKEQEEQNEFDLNEIKHYYGSWDEVRKLIDRMEENEAEAASERQYEGDGIFADNH